MLMIVSFQILEEVCQKQSYNADDYDIKWVPHLFHKAV